ncbi:hypothetical protein N665_0339s0108 [Sinapis alba]|nr:hypothetical protein N665_0339s0108 [Sinapis alba]
MITCLIKLPFQSCAFGVSFILGSNCRKERRLLWDELETSSRLPQLCGLPWIVMGDFNEIISPSEHSCGDQSTSSRGMRDFKECLQRCSLSDLQFSGTTFTWSNSSISKKLDRVLCNQEWLEQFPESISLKHLKPILRSFNKENFSELEKRFQEAFDHLTRCQHQSLTAPTSTTSEAERIAHLHWFTLAKAEDSFLKQRSRIQWTVDGDANTTFYHRVIKSRQSQNHIHFLLDEDDRVIDSLDGVKQHAVNYFHRLLGGG